MNNSPLDYLAACDVVEPASLAFHQIMSRGGWVRIEWLHVVRGIAVERFLGKYHIPICGRGFTLKTQECPTGTLYCYVKEQQARWAEYHLKRVRVPLANKPFDPRNAEWAAKWDGVPVPAWDDRPHGGGQRKRTSRRK